MNIKDYQGLNALKVLKTENERQVYQANWDQLNMNYDGHVEWQRLKHQILYCEETKEYLYADPEPVKYVPGTRPVLEKEVAEAVKGCTTDRERVLRLLEFCRDLYLNRGKGPIWSQQRPGRASANYDFYGGSEEVLIEKGENLCECMGRLMVDFVRSWDCRDVSSCTLYPGILPARSGWKADGLTLIHAAGCST